MYADLGSKTTKLNGNTDTAGDKFSPEYSYVVPSSTPWYSSAGCDALRD